MNRLARFRALPRADRDALVEATLGLIGASVRLRVMSFGRLATRLGRHMQQSAMADEPALVAEVKRVRWAVETAARLLPWQPSCFPQAVAATALLRRRRISSTLYFGVDRGHDMEAHAWVRAGSVIVTGAPHHTRFTVVSTFA